MPPRGIAGAPCVHAFMHPRDVQPLVEAYLVIDQPRQRHTHWSTALAPLDARRAPPLAAVAAYYDASADQALLALRYDELALGRDGLTYVVEIALLEEIGMIQPAELTQGDRRRFLGERLARCALQVMDHRGVVETLAELVRRIREQRSAGKAATIGTVRAPSSPPPIPPAARRPRAEMRGDTADPVLLVNPKGTRDDLPQAEQVKLAKSTRDELPRQAPPPAPPARAERSASISPHVIPRNSRAQTVEVPASEAYRMATSSMPSSMPSMSGPTPPGIIYARYLRSGRWVPIRIGALSLKGAALLTGALPRIHDHVDVALSFGGHRALVRGNVGKVSSQHEAQLSGASTFSVSFDLDDASRRQLTQLLTAARAANVTIKPPPARSARRFPVEMQVGLGTSRGVVRGEALDVSREGLFVRPAHALDMSSVVSFSSVLDDGEPCVGRARVVRHITEAEARVCGLAPGYGLSISDMGDADRDRWAAFLGRIEKRADRRILIGAAPARLAELQQGLAAYGYAVNGGSDPGALVQLAAADRPVDAALIDGNWLAPATSGEWIESLFAARNVPCVTVHGDVRRARATIDRLLSVS